MVTYIRGLCLFLGREGFLILFLALVEDVLQSSNLVKFPEIKYKYKSKKKKFQVSGIPVHVGVFIWYR